MLTVRAGSDAVTSLFDSIVMRLDYGYFSMLLAGDAEEQTEHRMLTKDLNLQVQVLKVSDIVVMGHGHLQLRRKQRKTEQRQAKADDHASEQVRGDDSHRGRHSSAEGRRCRQEDS